MRVKFRLPKEKFLRSTLVSSVSMYFRRKETKRLNAYGICDLKGYLRGFQRAQRRTWGTPKGTLTLKKNVRHNMKFGFT